MIYQLWSQDFFSDTILFLQIFAADSGSCRDIRGKDAAAKPAVQVQIYQRAEIPFSWTKTPLITGVAGHGWWVLLYEIDQSVCNCRRKAVEKYCTVSQRQCTLVSITCGLPLLLPFPVNFLIDKGISISCFLEYTDTHNQDYFVAGINIQSDVDLFRKRAFRILIWRLSALESIAGCDKQAGSTPLSSFK